jgi:hypothetical protein
MRVLKVFGTIHLEFGEKRITFTKHGHENAKA